MCVMQALELSVILADFSYFFSLKSAIFLCFSYFSVSDFIHKLAFFSNIIEFIFIDFKNLALCLKLFQTYYKSGEKYVFFAKGRYTQSTKTPTQQQREGSNWGWRVKTDFAECLFGLNYFLPFVVVLAVFVGRVYRPYQTFPLFTYTTIKTLFHVSFNLRRAFAPISYGVLWGSLRTPLLLRKDIPPSSSEVSSLAPITSLIVIFSETNRNFSTGF